MPMFRSNEFRALTDWCRLLSVLKRSCKRIVYRHTDRTGNVIRSGQLNQDDTEAPKHRDTPNFLLEQHLMPYLPSAVAAPIKRFIR